MTCIKNQQVKVVDPDLAKRTLVDAWHQGIDKATGQHLVVLDGEEGVIRRIKPENVFTPLKLVVG
ncbi:MAG: hypothetical protein KJ667_08855 [Alphaproteobacteria bacterium]|nr:hypothetical protein [Alphaproteobacteria bacterium]